MLELSKHAANQFLSQRLPSWKIPQRKWSTEKLLDVYMIKKL